MAVFVSLRSQPSAGPVHDAQVYEGQAGSANMRPRSANWLSQQVASKDVLLATHGFNVNQQKGVNSLAHFGARLATGGATGQEYFIGVLWPGDWWIPVVNYPAEASDAVDSGRRLAKFCNAELTPARSLSFISHSLGARVILEAIGRLNRRARVACITAAAADFDCLDRQCAAARENCDMVVNLASRRDRVLKYAYPAGDLVSDLFGDDDSPLGVALGRAGPKRPWDLNVQPHQISDGDGYDHGDYLPPSDQVAAPDRWEQASDFMIRAFRRQRQTWP